ncbi:hypothetical protein DFH09DRAFT_1071047 [Mycena vulgaris]|nr:hypothetical protein DFH09DRAFT_1071047 [Mycena vulgaris]
MRLLAAGTGSRCQALSGSHDVPAARCNSRPGYDASKLRRAIFEKSLELEDQGSKYRALLELGYSALGFLLIFLTDAVSPLPDEGGIDAAYSFDNERETSCISGEELHGLPYGVGADVWPMLARITGMSFADWNADHESNGIRLHIELHKAFADFKIYLEQNTNIDMVVHYRSQPPSADVRMDLSTILSVKRKRSVPTGPRWRDPSASSCDRNLRTGSHILDVLNHLPGGATPPPGFNLFEGSDEI